MAFVARRKRVLAWVAILAFGENTGCMPEQAWTGTKRKGRGFWFTRGGGNVFWESKNQDKENKGSIVQHRALQSPDSEAQNDELEIDLAFNSNHTIEPEHVVEESITDGKRDEKSLDSSKNSEIEEMDAEEETSEEHKFKELKQRIASLRVRMPSWEEDEEEEYDVENLEEELTYYTWPAKLLHAMGPKIRAIRTSPEYMLRIRSASASDANLAGFAIGHLARQSKLYADDVSKVLSSENQEELKSKLIRKLKSGSWCRDLLLDRRLEQLVECVLCGVSVRDRIREAEHRQEDRMSDAIDADLESIDQKLVKSTTEDEKTIINVNPIEEESKHSPPIHEQLSLIEEHKEAKRSHSQPGPGIAVDNASFMVWGISTLLRLDHDLRLSRQEEDDQGDAKHPENLEATATPINLKLGGESVGDILVAVSLHCREELLARWYQIWTCTQKLKENLSNDNSAIVQYARDVAITLWSFAHVPGSVREGSHAPLTLCRDLAETCCSILTKLIGESDDELVLDTLSPKELHKILWACDVFHQATKVEDEENDLISLTSQPIIHCQECVEKRLSSNETQVKMDELVLERMDSNSTTPAEDPTRVVVEIADSAVREATILGEVMERENGEDVVVVNAATLFKQVDYKD